MVTDTRGPRNWSGIATAYADSFAHLCAGTIPDLVAHALLDADPSVLEVGAGSGLLSARLAGAGARLTSLDPDPDMLRLLRSVVPAEVPTVHAALPHLPFKDDSFDVVIANFVVNHIGDPRDGARELARVIRSGGRALATGWTNRSTAQRELFQSVLERAGATPPESDLLPPGLGFERSVDGLAGLFADAGLTILVGEEVDVVWRIAPDRFWSALEAGIGGIGKALLQQEPEVRKRMRAAYDDLSAELLDGGELVLPAPAVFVVAQN